MASLIGNRISRLDTPALLVDLDIVAVNIARIASACCGFRGKVVGDSDAFQPLIPRQTSHRFRSKPATL